MQLPMQPTLAAHSPYLPDQTITPQPSLPTQSSYHPHSLLLSNNQSPPTKEMLNLRGLQPSSQSTLPEYQPSVRQNSNGRRNISPPPSMHQPHALHNKNATQVDTYFVFKLNIKDQKQPFSFFRIYILRAFKK